MNENSLNEGELRASMTAKEQRRNWLIGTGKAFRMICILGIALIIGYQAPAIGDVPLGQITANQLLKSLACFGLALGCLKWAFAGTTDENAESWGAFALLIFFALVGLGFFLNR